MGPPASHRVTRVPWYSGYRPAIRPFAYGAVTLFGDGFPAVLLLSLMVSCAGTLPRLLESSRFRLLRVRSPLLAESLLFSFPAGTKMFQFPAYPFDRLCIHLKIPGHLPPVGFPIRKSADRKLFAPPRSLSQLVASFVGSWCQGIHPAPLKA